MRSEEQIGADAERGNSPFSNGSEFEIWSARWCDRCRNDNPEAGKFCPILTVAMLGDWPAEWTRASKPYTRVDTCTEFEERTPGGEPDQQPEPDPLPGQTDLFGQLADACVEDIQAAVMPVGTA